MAAPTKTNIYPKKKIWLVAYGVLRYTFGSALRMVFYTVDAIRQLH